MPPKKSSTLPYLFASLGFITIAIVISTIVSRSKDASTSVDIRTRATSASLVEVTGLVAQVDDINGTIVVDDLRFEGSEKSLGTWTVTPPPSFAVTSVFPGERITISVSPPTMLAETHTLTATEITVSR